MDDDVKCAILTINGIVIGPITALLMIGYNKCPELGFVLIILCMMLVVGATLVYA